MTKTVLFMAGGTGGHVFPALAVAKEMKARGYDVQWLGTASGIEKDLVPAAGYPLHCITIAGLRGKGKLGLIKSPWLIAKAIWQARKIINKIKPVAVLGMGGYATGPGGVAAKLAGIPLLIHEQNAYAGMTNKLLHKISDQSLQAFPGALDNALVTGNPVRGDVFAISNQISSDSERLKVLVVGGSLGAVALNTAVLEAMQGLPENQRPELWHQAGKRNIDALQQDYQQAGIQAKVTAFIEDMAAAYQWADLVVCRSGALTVSEIAAAGKAAIFVPFPFAVDDHQTANAGFLTERGAGVLCQQKALTPQWLAAQWLAYQADKTVLQKMADTARQLAKPDATAQVAGCIESILRD